MLSTFVLAAALGAAAAAAQTAPPSEIRAEAVSEPPRIDGLLDDRIWERPPIQTDTWRSYNPLYGDTVPQQTQVWVAYDADYIYFAFRCEDPQPDAIKSSVSRRDNITADDWVGVSLDALGTGQLSYHMMVNPSGVQLDMLNSVAANEDWTVDWVWESAGRRTDTGYAVEMRLPLQSIRFKGTAGDVRMGVLFWRRVSRLGVSVAWPPLEPGKWVFETHVPLVFANLRPRLPRELTPSVSASRQQTRDTPETWSRSGRANDVGVSAKFGVTPTVTVDVTGNPDFSQVESDAFQVEVNQRFPVFYSEKRPFFMEGSGIFALAGTGNGDNSLQAAVHTRRIVDPVAGAKLTGSVGRVTFGTLSAVDQAAGRDLAPGAPGAGADRVFNVARAQYSLGPSNYLGAIATDTVFAGAHNQVAGGDVSWRVSRTQRASGFLLASSSDAGGGNGRSTGIGTSASYNYSTRAATVNGSFEHYSTDFRMDTAFLNRVGITSGWAYSEWNTYPDKNRYPWLRRVTPFVFLQGGTDRIAGGDDFLTVSGARLNFTRQGFLRVDRTWGHETWARERFPRGRFRSWGNVQLYRWLKLDGRFEAGRATYYDATAPFAGVSRTLQGGFVLQPSGRLSQSLSYSRVAFDRRDTGARVYTVDIANAKTIFQFTRQLFLRGILQYDSARARILTDTLLSYELNPGTVAYVGYGSLIERRDFQGGAWQPGVGDYLTTRRGLLLKVSYLWRF